MSHRKHSDNFKSAVENLTVKLKKNLVDSPAYADLRGDEWLRTFYDSFSNRWLADNDRIWRTGSILIPLSLAAFAALPTINCPKAIHLLTLAIISSALMMSWLVIAENQRALVQKSLAWIAAIEGVLGLENIGEPKVRGGFFNRIVTFRGAIRIIRWMLTILVIVGWLWVLKYWPRCTAG